MKPVPLILDLETCSNVDLRKSGGFVYAENCRLICAAWTEDLGKSFSVWFPHHERFPQALIDLQLPGVTCYFGGECPVPTNRVYSGHNSWGFDEPVWEALYPDHKPEGGWIDSSVRALAAGLPGSLQQIATRLWGEGKYEEGSDALKKASRSMDAVPVGVAALIGKYNVQDVRLQAWVEEELAASYHPTEAETKVQETHRLINRRGVRIDTGLVTRLYGLSNDAVDYAVAEITRLTGGKLHSLKCLRSRPRVFDWVLSAGIKELPNDGTIDPKTRKKKLSLRRDVVDNWIKAMEALPEDEEPGNDEDEETQDAEGAPELVNVSLVTEVLSLRQMAMRITAGKLAAAGLSLNKDGRARGLFAYYAAHTGRWGGRRIQLQNLPRPKEGVPFWDLVGNIVCGVDLSLPGVRGCIEEATAKVNAGKIAASQPPIRTPTPDDAASAMIRGIFVPEKGKVYFAADLASIEVRVLAWLAGEQWLLDAFWGGLDPYLTFAEKVTGRRYDKKAPERQFYKVVLLGSGYQLGATKLVVYLAAQGISLEDYGVSAESTIDAYRDAHPHIAGFIDSIWEGKKVRRRGLWQNYENAALDAIRTGHTIKTNKVSFRHERGHLYVTLPSGRELTYRNCRIERRPYYGKWKDTFVFYSPRFRDTTMYGGKWAENITQAVARDVMAEMLVAEEDAGLDPVIHIHDETVCESDLTRLPEFRRIHSTVPAWAPGLPVDSEGTWLPRYAKSPPPGRKDEEWKCPRA